MKELSDWETGQPAPANPGNPAGFPGTRRIQGDRLDAAIVEAVRTYPLDEAPAALRAGVMSRLKAGRIQAGRLGASMPRFRLTWVDFALSLFFAAMLGAVMLVGVMLPPPLAAYLRLQMRYWFQMLTLQPVLPLVLAAVSLASAGAAVLLAARLAWVRGILHRPPVTA